jgi:hypothetical protein
MFTPVVQTVARASGASLSRRVASRSGWCIGLILVLGASDASAAALSRLVSSAGALAALAALLVMKNWPSHVPASMLPTAGGALALAGGALWWWRVRPLAGLVAAADATRPSGSFGSPRVVDLPPGFDRGALQASLRRQFVGLQAAWDSGDMDALAALTTPEMFEEFRMSRPGIAGPGAGAPSETTGVVTLEANLLGFEALGLDFVVSVEFSGLIRESERGGAVPFRELWMLTRSNREADGWRLARHQALL